jgi:hypothetical protein
LRWNRKAQNGTRILTIEEEDIDDNHSRCDSIELGMDQTERLGLDTHATTDEKDYSHTSTSPKEERTTTESVDQEERNNNTEDSRTVL